VFNNPAIVAVHPLAAHTDGTSSGSSRLGQNSAASQSTRLAVTVTAPVPKPKYQRSPWQGLSGSACSRFARIRSIVSDKTISLVSLDHTRNELDLWDRQGRDFDSIRVTYRIHKAIL
jgi:hypothetical protein